MMENLNFNSVASLVNSTHSRKSRELLPSLAPGVPPRKPTDFSIRKILGLENDETHKETICSAPVLCRHFIPTLSPQQHSHSDTSPRLSPCSDNGSSASDYDSESDQVSTHYEQPPRIKKKRQRTTFSPLEVWELERAYRRQPYLTDKDEEDLVQRLGITAKSLKHWFQNRRAKSRREEDVTSRYQSSSSNLFGRPVRRGVLTDRQRFWTQSPPDQWKHTECTRMSYQALENHLKVLPHSRPIRAGNHYLSIKSNQLRGGSSLLVPMLRPDQFKRRPVESRRLPHSGGFHRNHQTYY